MEAGLKKKSSMKLLNVACNITKEGSPLEARTEEIFLLAYYADTMG